VAGQALDAAGKAGEAGIGAATELAGQTGAAASATLQAVPGMAVRSTDAARRLVQQLNGAPREQILAVVRAAGNSGRATLQWTMDGAKQNLSALNPLASRVAQAGAAGAAVAGQAMNAAGSAAAGAAGHVGQAMGTAGSAVAGAAGQAGDVISDGAARAAPHAAAAAAAAQQGAQQAAASAAMAARAAKEQATRLGAAIASSSFAQGAASSAADFTRSAGNQMASIAGQINWQGAAKSSYSMISTVAVAAAAAAAGVVAKCNCVDILKLEIFVTAYQSIALFFTTISSQALENAKVVWGNLSTIISFEWGYTFSFNPIYVYVLIAVLALLVVGAFIWMVCKACSNVPDQMVDGHESKTWEDIKSESSYTVMAIQYILVAAMGIYLPVARVCIQIFICDGSMAKVIQDQLGGAGAGDLSCTVVENTDPPVFDCDCGAWDGYTAFQGLAVLLAIYMIFLPIFIWYLITNNAPVGSDEDPNKRFDPDGNGEEGTMIEYTDQQYQADLKEDPRYSSSPYVGLIDGIERGHMHYKVIDLVFKLLLVVPVVVLQRSPVP